MGQDKYPGTARGRNKSWQQEGHLKRAMFICEMSYYLFETYESCPF